MKQSMTFGCPLVPCLHGIILPLLAFLAFSSQVVCISGAVGAGLDPETAPSAGDFWKPPPGGMTVPAKDRTPEIPASLDQQRLGLADVLDIALRNNSAAKASWADARAAAAGYGSAKAAYFPAVTFDGSLALKNTKDSNAGTDTGQQNPGGALNLSWLLLDFGSRDASRDQAFQLLLDANWKHNTMLQDTILAVEKAYFQYMAAKSTLLARQADIQDGELHLAAAEALHQAGVATIADVLQMKTVLAQARLNLQTAQGDIFTNRGALAVAMGLSANMPFDIDDEPGPVDPEATSRRVEELIDLALAKRPDYAITEGVPAIGHFFVGAAPCGRPDAGQP